MDFVDKMKQIIADFEEMKVIFKMKEDENTCGNLDEFLDETLATGDENIIKSFIDNLGLILKYTSCYSNWMNYKEIYNYSSFYTSLKKNIKYYNGNRVVLFGKMMTSSEIAHKFCERQMLEVLLAGDCDSPGLCNIFNILPSGDKILFLKTVLSKKVHISFRRFNFSNKEYVYVLSNRMDFLKLTTDLFDFSKRFIEDNIATNDIDSYVRAHPEMLDNALLNESYITTFGPFLSEIIILVIKDVIKNEGALLSEMEWLVGGAFSNVLRIKNKVIKIGRDRESESFPNNPYIVKPLLRKVFEHENKRLFIEVTEVVNTKEFISKKEMYELYVKLRRLGIICSDFHEGNIGVLIRDNKIYWRFPLELSDEALGLEPYVGDEELVAGELVLHDADNLFHEDDPLAHTLMSDMTQQFEKKYQMELKKSYLR